MTLWRPVTWTGPVKIELVAKQKWLTIKSEYLLLGFGYFQEPGNRVLDVFVSAISEMQSGQDI